jgi:hypothetical protein
MNYRNLTDISRQLFSLNDRNAFNNATFGNGLMREDDDFEATIPKGNDSPIINHQHIL